MAKHSFDWEPNRSTIIAATNLLKTLGHAGFDEMLLKLALPDEAGSGQGLKARAVSLAKYVIDQKYAPTPDGTPLAQAIVSCALQVIKNPGLVAKATADELNAFFAELKDDDRWLPPTPQENQKPIQLDKTIRMDAAVTRQNPLFTKQPTAAVPEPKKPAGLPRRVFIVHGHDEAAKEIVRRFLERANFEAVILHDRPNRGRTLIAKFQEEAANVGFAVVLMTPDDQGGKAGGEIGPRARQNVVFELGFFIGALGADRVAALVKGKVEHPSDFDAVVYIPLDPAGGWKQQLARELVDAGFEIDWEKAMA